LVQGGDRFIFHGGRREAKEAAIRRLTMIVIPDSIRDPEVTYAWIPASAGMTDHG